MAGGVHLLLGLGVAGVGGVVGLVVGEDGLELVDELLELLLREQVPPILLHAGDGETHQHVLGHDADVSALLEGVQKLPEFGTLLLDDDPLRTVVVDLGRDDEEEVLGEGADDEVGLVLAGFAGLELAVADGVDVLLLLAATEHVLIIGTR